MRRGAEYEKEDAEKVKAGNPLDVVGREDVSKCMGQLALNRFVREGGSETCRSGDLGTIDGLNQMTHIATQYVTYADSD